MTKQEIEAELAKERRALESAKFQYDVSPFASGPRWRQIIDETERRIRQLEKELETANA